MDFLGPYVSGGWYDSSGCQYVKLAPMKTHMPDL